METEMANPSPIPCQNLLANPVLNFLWNNKNRILISCLLIACLGLSFKVYLFRDKPFSDTMFYVSSDGSEQFRTISDAVNATKDHNPLRTCITIKAGEYEETMTVPIEKMNLAFLGAGKNITIIKSNNLYPLTNKGSLNVEGRGFLCRDLTVKNIARYEEGDEVALKNSADESSFYRCSFLGFRRTLFVVAHKQFYRDSEIQGSLYFIYGAAEAFFQNCFIKAVQIGKDEVVVSGNVRSSVNQNSALVFQHCDFVTSEVMSPVYLGAPLTAYSTVVVMQSNIDGSVNGWRLFSEIFPDCRNSSFLAEFMNYGDGAQRLKGRSPCTPTMEKSIAEQFTLGNFLNGSLWIPKNIPYQLDIRS